MRKAYHYAIMEPTDDPMQMQITRLDNLQRTTKVGLVRKVGPGKYKAKRLYGSGLTKEFTVSIDAFSVNEDSASGDAMRWACESRYVSDMRDEQTRKHYKHLVK